jgi:hypothetical protein
MTVSADSARYLAQSRRFQDLAMRYLRQGDWAQVSEPLWGSLAAALKAVAAVRGVALRNEVELRAYAQALAEELNDMRAGDAFQRIDALGESIVMLAESRFMLDHLYMAIEIVSSAIERFRALVEPPPQARRRTRE